MVVMVSVPITMGEIISTRAADIGPPQIGKSRSKKKANRPRRRELEVFKIESDLCRFQQRFNLSSQGRHVFFGGSYRGPIQIYEICPGQLIHHESLSRYSSGTSSSGTSWVCTSCSSKSPACSTPLTAPASKAFPSSNNSSTLSESARGRRDNPSRSPDCWPRCDNTPPAARSLLRTDALAVRVLFFPAFF